MKVKTLASQTFLNRLERTIQDKESNLEINFERYGGFKEVFGAKDYGFVLAGDVQKEVRTGEKAPVYLFGEGFKPYVAEKGLNCDLFLASNFLMTEGVFPSRAEVEEIVDYLGDHKDQGKIVNLVNSKKGTLAEDKTSILELQSKGFDTPETIYFHNFNVLKSFIENDLGKYVIKHRFGERGNSLFRINKENINDFKDLDVQNFIVQEEINILNEKRLIFFGNELIGSRIIHDRHMPWEEEGKAGRQHLTKNYYPTPNEIADSRRIMDLFDSKLGCIDWVEVNGKGRLYMEYNGVGTGWGLKNYVYNLNKTVAEKLKSRYLK